MSIYLRLLLALILFSCLTPSVVAEHNITLLTPVDGDGCVTDHVVNFSFYLDETATDGCRLWHNNSGVWSLESAEYLSVSLGYNYFIDEVDSNTILWGVECHDKPPANIDWSDNFTFTVVDAPYCAVLSSTSCMSNPNKGGFGTLKTRLGNTQGFWLEGQDCNVWIEDVDGETVEVFNSMIYQQEVKQFYDSEGNIANLVYPEFPLTDSQGWFVFKFLIDPEWAWVGDNYTIYAVCNGQQTSCDFSVDKSKSPADIENIRLMGKNFGGLVIVFMVILGIAVFVVRTLWLRLRGKR